MRKRNKKNWIIGAIVFLLVLTGCTVGGSYYMLNFSLTPNAKIRAKDADSYKYMYANYPFLRPWVDSLNKVNALKGYGYMHITLPLPNQQRKQLSLYMVIPIMPYVCS